MRTRIATHFKLGKTVTVEARFTDDDGVAYDPETVRFRTVDPLGAVVNLAVPDPAIRNPVVGTYESDIDLNVEGEWHYRFEGLRSAPVPDAAVEEAIIIVPESKFTLL